jgi:hypothetical protein
MLGVINPLKANPFLYFYKPTRQLITKVSFDLQSEMKHDFIFSTGRKNVSPTLFSKT